MFGPNSKVDVAGLIASTADISNQDFLAGRYQFTANHSDKTILIADGADISIADKGLAVFVARDVENRGLIRANLGQVVLASGQSFNLLDMYGDQLINFQLTHTPAEQSGSVNVSSSGKIIADGGSVLLTANAASDVVNNVINMQGVIQARSAYADKTDAIILDSGANGVTSVSGKLDVTSSAAKGGVVKLLGKQVNVEQSAIIDASGKMGGGEILVGGNYQGKGSEPNAKSTYVARGAKLTANASQYGDGGKIIVWADDNTLYQGTINATGGYLGGNGGNAEVSGKKLLAYDGLVDLTASNGKTGNLLLDPYDLTITSSGTIAQSGNRFSSDATHSQLDVVTLLNALQTANITIQTGNGGAGQGNLTITTNINGGTSWTNNNLTLLAHNNIVLNPNVSITKSSGSGNLNLRADSDANSAGTVTFNAGSKIIFTGSSGNVNIYYNPTSYAAPTN